MEDQNEEIMLGSRTIIALLTDMMLPCTVSPPKLIHANPEEMEPWKTRTSWCKLLLSWEHTHGGQDAHCHLRAARVCVQCRTPTYLRNLSSHAPRSSNGMDGAKRNVFLLRCSYNFQSNWGIARQTPGLGSDVKGAWYR